MTNRIYEYVEDKYKKGGDVSPKIENEERYTIPRPTSTAKTSTTTENNFYTVVLNMEVVAYAKHRYIPEENI